MTPLNDIFSLRPPRLLACSQHTSCYHAPVHILCKHSLHSAHPLLLLFLWAGVQPTLDLYMLRPFYDRPIALTQEGRSLVNDVCKCVHDWWVRKGWVGVSNLSGTCNAPLLGVAYCLAQAQLIDACYSTSVSGPPSQVYLLRAKVSAAGTLTLLIKVPATVTFHRGHHQTLCCLPGIISLIIMCIGIIFT